MKCIVFLGLIACAFAVDSTTSTTKAPKSVVPIISQENVVEANGKYHYNYESGDGTKTNQEGELKQVDPENAGEAVKGQYSYTGDDGTNYLVEYTADENGYQAKGAHLPTPPPIPPHIVRALAHLATLPPSTETPKSKN